MFSKKFIKKFWSSINIGNTNECWEWKKKCYNNGYGRTYYNYKSYGANRVAYWLAYKDPGDLKVLHHCDNPPCCNPNHLFLGTHQDNANDRVRKGRSAILSGEKNGRAKITKDIAIAIRYSIEDNKTLAQRYNISPSHVSDIKNGRKWKTLTP